MPRSALLMSCLLGCLAGLFGSQPARADLQICNKTESRIGIAIGYKDRDGWTTEGWWNIAKGSCETILRGPLVARFYYLFGIDYDRGGEWAGKAFMCTRDKEFTIRGIESCLARGYDRTGFFEVDTGDQKNWVVNLSDPAAAASANAPAAPAQKQPGPARPPETQQAQTPAPSKSTPLPNAPVIPGAVTPPQGTVPAFTAPAR